MMYVGKSKAVAAVFVAATVVAAGAVALVPQMAQGQAQRHSESLQPGNNDENSDVLPAFPGAEGYGARSVGGRGGRVIKVTTLDSSGPGSLQWACDQPGPRIIVFDVSGVIVPPNVSKGRRYLALRHSNVTIAGQTAPGAGITIAGQISAYRGTDEKPLHDVVLRFLRVRPIVAEDTGRNVRGMELTNSEDIVVDHVSACWSIDDCFDLYVANRATVQWCTAEESGIWLEGGDEPHNFGMITGYDGPRPISVHHTLLANHRERTPLCGSYPTDFRNNVIYNSGEGMSFLVFDRYADEHRMNIVGNYSKAGPGGIIGVRVYKPPYTVGQGRIGSYHKDAGHFYLDGNLMPWQGGYVEPWRDGPHVMSNVVEQEFPMAPVTTDTAEDAYQLVAAQAGCLPRDAVSRRTIREMQTGTGSWGHHHPAGGLMEGLSPGTAPPDADNDGMPDAWETAHGLDPNNPSDAQRIVPRGASPGDRHAGYTFIEFYVDERADLLVAEAVTRARLDPEPDTPWDKPADGLSPMAMAHDSIDEMLAAIRDQNMARQNSPDLRVRENTHAAWFAVQQLSRMGAKARPAVPALVEMLRADDRRTAAFAAWALGAIGPDAAEAVPALAAVIEKDWKAPYAKWTFSPVPFAAWALGRIGTDRDEAVEALAEAASGQVHVLAVDPALFALRQTGAKAAGALDVLLEQIDRTHAPEALANVGTAAVPRLIELLGDGHVEKRLGALKALGLIGPGAKPAVPGVIERLGDEHPWVRARAAWALGRIDPGSAVVCAAVAAAMNDADTNVRYQAAGALAKCDASNEALGALERALLKDRRNEVRAAAAAALGRLGAAAVDVLTRGALQTDNAFVRKHCARALGHSDAGHQAVDALAQVLADADPEVRREAVWALALIGPPGKPARAALKKALGDEDYVVRFAAAEATKRIER